MGKKHASQYANFGSLQELGMNGERLGMRTMQVDSTVTNP